MCLLPSPPGRVEQVLAVRAQLQKLRDDKKVALEPFIAASADVDAQAAKLRVRRAELLKELEGALVKGHVCWGREMPPHLSLHAALGVNVLGLVPAYGVLSFPSRFLLGPSCCSRVWHVPCGACVDCCHAALPVRPFLPLPSPAIDDQVKKLAEQKASIQRSVSETESAFKAQSASLDASNKGLSELVARAEAVRDFYLWFLPALRTAAVSHLSASHAPLFFSAPTPAGARDD